MDIYDTSPENQPRLRQLAMEAYLFLAVQPHYMDNDSTLLYDSWARTLNHSALVDLVNIAQAHGFVVWYDG